MKQKGIISKILSNIYVKNILLMVIVVVILIAATLFGLNIYTKHSESVSVPSVKGLQVEEAAGILKSKELTYEVVDSAFLAEGKPGAIIEQAPSEESNVKKGRTVYLTIQAKGQQMVVIPALKDYSQRQAEAQLNALGFTKIIISQVPSRYRGLVIAVEYKGKEVLPDQKIPKGVTLRMVVGAGGADSDNTKKVDIDKSFFE